MDEDLETREETKDTNAKVLLTHFQRPEQHGMSQRLKSDIGVCVVIILITILGIIVTALKIVIIDMNSVKYAALFGNNVTTTTTVPTE